MPKRREEVKVADARRILIYHGTDGIAGLSIRDFMRKKLGFSERLMSRVKYRPDGILLNGKCVRATAVIGPGDELRLDITDPDSGSCVWIRPDPYEPPRVLYEDEDLLILDKPAGLVCHPSFGHYSDTLANAAAIYLGFEGRPRVLHMIGRLDRDTSGCVAIAKNSAASDYLFRQQETGEFRKVYLAAVSGHMENDSGFIDTPIARVPGVFMLRTTDPAGQSARTDYKVLGEEMSETKEAFSLLAVTIEHGRTHQIRVHMASIGHPVLGDLLYGPGGARDAYLASGDPEIVRVRNTPENAGGELHLCAYMVAMRQPFTGKKIVTAGTFPGWAGEFGEETKIREKVREILLSDEMGARTCV